MLSDNSQTSKQTQDGMISGIFQNHNGSPNQVTHAKGINDLQASAQSQNLLLDMINNSFINMPLMQDQDVVNIRCPLAFDDAIRMTDNAVEQSRIMQELAQYRYFPTSSMFKR